MVDSKKIKFLDKVFVRRPYFDASQYQVGKLRDVLKTNVFKNAIWLASTEFYNELGKKDFDFDVLTKKERLTALKFYNRMSFRATPFGAFSAFGLVDWQPAESKPKKVTDGAILHLLPSIQMELSKIESQALVGEVLIAVNPTLYKLSSGWRYTRYETDEKGKLSFFVYLLAYDQVDELLIDHLREKPLPLADLINYIIELTDCTIEEAGTHIEKLVEEQVLITDQTLSLLHNGPLNEQVSVEFNVELQLPDFISQNKTRLGKVKDGKSVYAGLELIDSIGLPDHLQIPIMEALKALDLLAPIPPKNNIDKFREAFEQKFGNRRVPLLEALDPDLGVIFDDGQHSDEHQMLRDLTFEQEPQKSDQITWTPVHQLLMEVWLQNNKRDKWEPVVLTADDLNGLPGNSLPFPPSTSVFCSLAQDKIVFHNIGGATANALTGRFSAFSDDFEAFCKSTASFEAAINPNVLFAEVLQVSHRKIDNINRRRQVYGHVIPLNSFPQENAILPKEIDVLVKGEEIILVHRLNGKRVIPRLPTAFNYHHNGMPLFRFLCALQYKSIRANFDFDPAKVFPGLNFYSRIEYGKTVLSLAKWHLSSDEINMLLTAPLSISRLHLFCRDRGIPVKILEGKGDQQLAFDLSNDEEAMFFLESLKGMENTVITEIIIADNAKSAIANGSFKRQFVMSLLNTEAVYSSVPERVEPDLAVRDFDPGSEWVYLKIYATNQSLQLILTDTLLPWINRNRDRIKQWFFIRYYDKNLFLLSYKCARASFLCKEKEAKETNCY